MKVIILAGGNGTRLWPLSRTNYPKQFLKLKDMNKSIFQMTLDRSLKLTALNDIYIITNEKYKFLVMGQIEELGYEASKNNILIEPLGKNTLPAIYYGVKEIQREKDEVVVVFPSDHLIKDEASFTDTIFKGIGLTNNYLVTFGVKPNKPHTGYGYIKPGQVIGEGSKVDEFKEKPEYLSAQLYLEKGYLWNSGMFMFRTDVFAEEIKKYSPIIYNLFNNNDLKDFFEAVPSISIDFGIMEKSQRIAVIPMDVKWSDLGSFDSFYEEFPKDKNGNINFGKDNLVESKNNLIYTDNDKVVALIGVNDLIVIDEKDALLICKKDNAQKVKKVVEKLKSSGDPRLDNHLTTYRPWGSYTILEEGLFYKIKRITVLPDKKLSYQLHHHRSEHWIVVKGTAKVTVEGEEFFVRSGESTYVKTGFKHRLENPGKVNLEVIEVQLGEYLEENDIVRIDDDFGRNSNY
ncbi:mannose-1-phosphate guanylyltransferase/mannose-6-phosphate isomerase [Desulforamulus aquiferis]|uniref:mannose-1-phosphate guanylyltransferase n=1 Tax=Desulforamulus aquiferis TaxID=1397668 RepID=A0AAW7ZC01_9FIRM|nr:mannose-1-phosphate guanylyltransferase/mannose-6-phosphate isomerase [Desulforamulus aquiferis]MDO7786847.1 mannose-1-phosphate guanylyltransferase/mannose-6-phosphate isomerase [Desulforamulus aquiferis]